MSPGTIHLPCRSTSVAPRNTRDRALGAVVRRLASKGRPATVALSGQGARSASALKAIAPSLTNVLRSINFHDPPIAIGFVSIFCSFVARQPRPADHSQLQRIASLFIRQGFADSHP